MLNFEVHDVFTDTPYKGNPLAILDGGERLSTAQMQAMAREFNLSETIYILPPADPAHTARVRIFTPQTELPFAGHPTIGCALFLARKGGIGEGVITLEEVAGLVPVVISEGATRAEFTAPVTPLPRALDLPLADIAHAFGLAVSDLGAHAPHVVSGGHPFCHIQLKDQDALSRAAPAAGWGALRQAAGTGSAYLYAPGPGADHHARMFAPDDGIGEDPATGSATALLAGQLLANGALAEGRNDLTLCQGRDMGRESWLHLSVDVSGGQIEAIRVAGQAVPVSKGQIAPPA